MHQIHVLFTKGQQLFVQREYSQAYTAFEECTQIMPSLSEAWENMAVCLVNQGVSIKTTTQTLLSKAPVDLHKSIVFKIEFKSSTYLSISTM